MFEFSVEQLRRVGWRPYAVAAYVNCWGHAQEFIPIPEAEGECFMIPVLGEAT